MVVQKIKDIDVKKIKEAKGVLAILELLGLTEDDLLLLKEIPAIKEELAELREFKESVIRVQRAESAGKVTKSVQDQIRDAFKSKVEEFNPNGK